MQTNKIAKLERINGELPAYTFPGCYPLFYLDEDNSIYCAKCATVEADDNDTTITNYDAYLEGETMQCESCNCDIESAYGEFE